MTFVSITRLRIRSLRFLPFFALYASRSLSQTKVASGFKGGELLNDRKWTFWTMTTWDSETSMRQYMLNGAHKGAMPKLMGWCDEASVVHWTQPDSTLPTWTEADHRMRTEGRISKVRNPSPQHAGLRYDEPRQSARIPIQAKVT